MHVEECLLYGGEQDDAQVAARKKQKTGGTTTPVADTLAPPPASPSAASLAPVVPPTALLAPVVPPTASLAPGAPPAASLALVVPSNGAVPPAVPPVAARVAPSNACLSAVTAVPLPPLPSAESVDAKGIQLQLIVQCEWAQLGGKEKEAYGPGVPHSPDYSKQANAIRKLVVAGHSTAFDLVKAILCAFGLDTQSASFSAGPNMGALHLVGSDERKPYIMLLDATEANDLIPGVEHRGKVGIETATTRSLKRVKVAQLLDRPVVTTAARKANQGARNRILLQCCLKPRPAFVIGVAMQAWWYAFVVSCEAIGISKTRPDGDMAISHQKTLPRCIGGCGTVRGGNTIAWEDSDDDSDDNKVAKIDALNRRFVGEQLSFDYVRWLSPMWPPCMHCHTSLAAGEGMDAYAAL